MPNPYVWAPVLPAQVVDDVATNALGAAVTAHDASIIAAAAVGMKYSSRITVGTPIAAATVTIPASLRRLEVFWNARGAAAAALLSVLFTVNNNTGAVYRYQFSQTNSFAGTIIQSGANAQASAQAGSTSGATSTAGLFGIGRISFNSWDAPHNGELNYTFETFTNEATTTKLSWTGGGGCSISGPYTTLSLFPNTGNWDTGSDFQFEGW